MTQILDETAKNMLAQKQPTPFGEATTGAVIERSPRRRGRRSMAEMRAIREHDLPMPGRTSRAGIVARSTALSLGARVRLARRRLGLSQQELAGPQYVASYISAIERDKIQPSLKALELLANRLGESVGYFLYGGYGSEALPAATEESDGTEAGFSLAVWDRLLELQLRLERATYLGGPGGQTLFSQTAQELYSIPRHQLTEYDRAQLIAILGTLALRRGETEQALAHLEEAVGLAHKTGQTSLELETRYHLGQVHQARHMKAAALAQHQACRDLLAGREESVSPDLVLQILIALAHDHLVLGHSAQALTLFEEVLQKEEYYSNPHLRAELLSRLAHTAQEAGDLSRARGYRANALSLYEGLNVQRQLLRLSSGVGELLVRAGRLAEAEKVLTQTVEASRQNPDRGDPDLALSYNSLAALRLEQGNLAEAERLSEAGLGLAREAGNQAAEGNALRLAAEVQARLDRPAQARELYIQAIEVLEAQPDASMLGDLYKAYGEALSHWGDYTSAVVYLRKAYDTKK